MVVEVLVEPQSYESLRQQEKYAILSNKIARMRLTFAEHKELLSSTRIWNISSTRYGGGVAEMMPHIVSLLREFGLRGHWMILEAGEHAERFFGLTKHIHNNIHGQGEPIKDNADQRELYESINRDNARQFIDRWGPFDKFDVIIMHDPQPAPFVLELKRQFPQAKCIWRCHIGLDIETEQTKAAWSFLEPYITKYDACVFSAHEYIPHCVKDISKIVHPSIAPLTPKNKELSAFDITQVLVQAGIIHPRTLSNHCGAIVTPYEHQANIYSSNINTDAAAEASSSKETNGGYDDDVGFLFLPIVTQVSRWDRLKGWLPLIRAFAALKRHPDRYSSEVPHGDEHTLQIQRNVVCQARLVLAGPDPRFIKDDPEGLQVLQELKDYYATLPAEVRRDIRIIELPMQDSVQNALIVNAIQRASYVVVQNSLQEGFGLTATEAMYKRVCFVGTRQAVGLRTQVRDGIDGLLVPGNPEEDHDAIARVLYRALCNNNLREELAVNGQKRAIDNFLIYTQMEEWCSLIVELCSMPRRASVCVPLQEREGERA